MAIGKRELILKTANQLIKLEEKFQEVDLKGFLEEGKFSQAYQTESKPRQWYIGFSEPNRYKQLRKEYLASQKSEIPLATKLTNHEENKADKHPNIIGWVVMIIIGLIGLIWIFSGKNNIINSNFESGNRNDKSTPRQWYEGGTLHKATGREWRLASHKNKLATSSDWVVAVRQKTGNPITNMNDVYIEATGLITCMDIAVSGGDIDDMAVVEIAAICLKTMDQLENSH